ncbi:hypothetical protein ACJJTC_016817 [Scirpophaga incertulas]
MESEIKKTISSSQNLETLIKANDKNNPTVNLSIDMSKNNTIEEQNSSSDYNDFIECRKTDSDQNSECSEKSADYFETGNLSLDKEDVMNIYGTNINVPFGIRKENQSLMMGNSEVLFSVTPNTSNSDKNYVVTINNRHYDLTPGLKELLLRPKPDLDIVTERDKVTYKDILHYTSAHKRHFNPNAQIKGDKGMKYRHIIKPLFSGQNDLFRKDSHELTKHGGYLPKNKKYKKNTDYIYWDDPNELIERLKLLIASQNAGNTNHDNEILSIIEELKEADIIE